MFHLGSLKKRENELRCEIQNRKIIKGQVLWNSNGFSNGQNTSSDKIYVKLLSISDGKEAIVKATKEFSKYNKPEEVTIDSVDSMLKRFYQFPDPNLGLYSGRQFVLYSYPPWQIRFTEFINVRTFKNINQKCFFETLIAYSNVQQNLGK